MRPENGRERRSEQGTMSPAETIRGFIHAALSHDAVADEVNDLLFEHVHGRLHESVVAASLRPILDEVLNTATHEDWTTVTDQLAVAAREALGDSLRGVRLRPRCPHTAAGPKPPPSRREQSDD